MHKYLQPKKYWEWFLWRWVKIRVILQKPFTLTTEAIGEQVIFQISSEKEYLMRYRSSYSAEMSTMYWIENCIRQGDVIWDIGANVGAYSLLLAKRLLSLGGGEVLAFEPESSNFYALNRNIQINDLSEILTAIPIAFGGRKKLGTFFLSSNETGSATHGLDKAEAEGRSFQPTHQQGIVEIGIDEFSGWDDVSFPNHIKIDVDGLEGEIIQNMPIVLNDSRLRTIVIEVADELSHGYIEKVIQEAGFVVDYEERWESQAGNIINYVFARK